MVLLVDRSNLFVVIVVLLVFVANFVFTSLFVGADGLMHFLSFL